MTTISQNMKKGLFCFICNLKASLKVALPEYDGIKNMVDGKWHPHSFRIGPQQEIVQNDLQKTKDSAGWIA